MTAPHDASRSGDFRTLTTLSELEDLASDWGRLCGDGSPIEGHAWSLACAEAFTGPHGLRVTVCLRDGAPRAIAPLEVRRRRSLGQLVMLGLEELDEPMGLVGADPAALDHLLAAMVRLGRPLFLQRIPAGSPGHRACRRLGARGIWVVERRQQPWPYIPLDPSWREPALHLGAARRSDIRRARRRAEAIGETAAEILTPEPRDLPPLLEMAFEVEAMGWKGEAGTALLQDRRRASFYRRFAELACAEGKLRICFLRIAGVPAAMQIAVVSGGRYWLLKIGYNPAFARCSSGILLIEETIRRAAADGLTSYEFLGVDAPWIRVWTTEGRPAVTVRIFPRRITGMVALALDAAASLHKRLTS